MKILRNLDLNNVVFIDIETVPIVEQLQEDTPLLNSWDYKVRHNRENEKFEGTLNESYIKNAALYAEFAKIVCITIGKVKDGMLKLKSYIGDPDQDVSQETDLLATFCEDLTKITSANKYTCLAGHAIKGFDIPFIMRRCLVNQVELPSLIDVGHLKPWELTAIDTMDLWKGTGFRSASLLNICTALGIISPKDEMEGQDTYTYYYHHEDGIELIRKYCEKDVLTVANVIRCCRYEPLLKVEKSYINVEKVGLVEKVFNGKTAKDKQQLVKQISILPMEEQIAAKVILDTVTNTK